MSAQPIFDDLKFYSEETIVSSTDVECKFNAKNEVLKILSVTGKASSISEEIIEDEIIYSGRVAFCVVYLTTDNETTKYECGVEFTNRASKTIDITSINYVTYDVENVAITKVDDEFLITANVLTTLKCLKENTEKILTNGEDILFNKEEKRRNRIVNKTLENVQVEEEFELGYHVNDVIYHNTVVSVTETQCGLGAVIIDGNFILTLITLQNNEKNDIVKEVKNIPFRIEVAVADTTPSMQTFARVFEQKTNIKVIVDENSKTSTVITTFDTIVYACVFEENYYNFTIDAYSTKNDVTIKKSSVKETYPLSQYSFGERVVGVSDCEAITSSELVIVLGERVTNLHFDKEINALTGIITATIVENREGEYIPQHASMPFVVPFTGKSTNNLLFDCIIEGFNCRARASYEFEANLKIKVTEICECEYTFISELFVGEEKSEKSEAISIYVAKDNDTLWDVCKVLGASAERITELNPNLQFPLNNNDRVIIYRNI